MVILECLLFLREEARALVLGLDIVGSFGREVDNSSGVGAI